MSHGRGIATHRLALVSSTGAPFVTPVPLLHRRLSRITATDVLHVSPDPMVHRLCNTGPVTPHHPMTGLKRSSWRLAVTHLTPLWRQFRSKKLTLIPNKTFLFYTKEEALKVGYSRVLTISAD
jgi:hypothetical protein